jgi:hypothetical protein
MLWKLKVHNPMRESLSSPGPCVRFCNMLIVYTQAFLFPPSPSPTFQARSSPLANCPRCPVQYSHISSICNMRMHHAMVCFSWLCLHFNWCLHRLAVIQHDKIAKCRYCRVSGIGILAAGNNDFFMFSRIMSHYSKIGHIHTHFQKGKPTLMLWSTIQCRVPSFFMFNRSFSSVTETLQITWTNITILFPVIGMNDSFITEVYTWRQLQIFIKVQRLLYCNLLSVKYNSCFTSCCHTTIEQCRFTYTSLCILVV